MSEIVRGKSPGPGRSEWVKYNGLVWTCSIPKGIKAGDDIAEHTRLALVELDRRLADAGTDKSRLIETTVYLTDMTNKDGFDKVWCEWLPENCGVARACVQAALAHGILIEIKCTAAAA